MKIRKCPSCGGRLIAEVMDDKVSVRCNACGQELGTFDRADKPVVINDMEIYPIATGRKNVIRRGEKTPHEQKCR